MIGQWKKIAEAFGRAVKRPGTGTRGKPYTEAAKRTDTGTEYNHGRWQGDLAEEDAAKSVKDYSDPKYQEEFDKAVDKQTDDALQAQFDKEIDRALKAAASRQHATNRGDMLGTVDDIEDDFREQIIDMLKEGRPIEEVLDILQKTGSQKPKLPSVRGE